MWQCLSDSCGERFPVPARITEKVRVEQWAKDPASVEKICCPFCHGIKIAEILKINKLSSKEYPLIFDTHLQIRWFWNPDGSFDGIEVHVANLTKRDQLLVEELNLKLAESLGISHGYTVEK